MLSSSNKINFISIDITFYEKEAYYITPFDEGTSPTLKGQETNFLIPTKGSIPEYTTLPISSPIHKLVSHMVSKNGRFVHAQDSTRDDTN